MENSESECVSWLELAPIEVILMIASHLKSRDLVQCCATSSTMRQMFSDNSIWRPLCNKELAEYLKRTPCKVEPMFVVPAMESTSLSPLPDWRISYMRELHLWNNWRKGKFLKWSIKDRYPSADFHSFYNNDIVIARYRDRIELLDVKAYPASDIVQRYFGTELSWESDFKTEIANDLIIFMSGSSVQVFELDLNVKICKLKHTFCFENSHTSTISGSPKESVLNIKKGEFKGIRLIVGHFLVGVLEGGSTLHIWNLETGQKLKEEHCFLKHCPCPVLQVQGSETMHLVLTVGKPVENTKTFLAYSLVNLKFLSFKETQDKRSEYLVHKDFVAIRFKRSVTVFNYQSTKTTAVFQTDSFPKAIKSNLFYILNSHIHVFDLNKNTTSTFSLDSVSRFEVLGDKFLQINGNERGKQNIWEIGETCQQVKVTEMKFNFESCGYFLNKACTKYIVREGIGMIMNFW